ncbi:hypothetical protein D6779_04730 [Candidatus Parcubacteria bacterium]|nr:MAG: hypothetical protein D6779_04730 [Candidatus Parcubacteria bacterium]
MASSPITPKLLRHLASLARVALQEKEADRLLRDLQRITALFGELQKLSMPHHLQETSHSDGRARDDAPSPQQSARGAEAFPETERSFLKLPPLFQ